VRAKQADKFDWALGSLEVVTEGDDSKALSVPTYERFLELADLYGDDEAERMLREYVRDNQGRFAGVPGGGLPDHLSDHDAERLTEMGVQTSPLPPNQRQKFALHGEQQYFWPTPGATGPEHGDVMRLVFPESKGYEQAPPDMMWGEYSRDPDGTYGISVNKGDFDDPTPADIARFKRMFPMAKRATFNYAEPRKLTDRLLGRRRPKVIHLQTEEV
jgi:hypothetical protein